MHKSILDSQCVLLVLTLRIFAYCPHLYLWVFNDFPNKQLIYVGIINPVVLIIYIQCILLSWENWILDVNYIKSVFSTNNERVKFTL